MFKVSHGPLCLEVKTPNVLLSKLHLPFIEVADLIDLSHFLYHVCQAMRIILMQAGEQVSEIGLRVVEYHSDLLKLSAYMVVHSVLLIRVHVALTY